VTPGPQLTVSPYFFPKKVTPIFFFSLRPLESDDLFSLLASSHLPPSDVVCLVFFLNSATKIIYILVSPTGWCHPGPPATSTPSDATVDMNLCISASLSFVHQHKHCSNIHTARTGLCPKGESLCRPIYLYGDNNSSLISWLHHLNHISSCVAVFEIAYAHKKLSGVAEKARDTPCMSLRIKPRKYKYKSWYIIANDFVYDA